MISSRYERIEFSEENIFSIISATTEWRKQPKSMENHIRNNHDVDTLQIPSYMLTNYQSVEKSVENHSEPTDEALGNHTKSLIRSTDEDIVVFNIGGEIFETLRETIEKDNISVLSNEEFLKRHYRPKARGYFFDRDPGIFRVSCYHFIDLQVISNASAHHVFVISGKPGVHPIIYQK